MIWIRCIILKNTYFRSKTPDHIVTGFARVNCYYLIFSNVLVRSPTNYAQTFNSVKPIIRGQNDDHETI